MKWLPALLPLLLLLAGAAGARPVTVSGSVGLLNDYRWRGISRSDRRVAAQAALTIEHRSGAWAGGTLTTLAGWGRQGSDVELALAGGWRFPVLGGDADAGLVWTLYPGGLANSSYAELFARLSGTLGPVQLAGSASYAPPQQALGRWYDSGAAFLAGVPQRPGAGGDNIYLKAGAVAAVPGTPVTLNGHVGHSRGSSGLGPNGRALSLTGAYWDWRLEADVVLGPVTLGLAWTDTSLNPGRPDYRALAPAFADRPITGSRGVISLTANF